MSFRLIQFEWLQSRRFRLIGLCTCPAVMPSTIVRLSTADSSLCPVDRFHEGPIHMTRGSICVERLHHPSHSPSGSAVLSGGLLPGLPQLCASCKIHLRSCYNHHTELRPWNASDSEAHMHTYAFGTSATCDSSLLPAQMSWRITAHVALVTMTSAIQTVASQFTFTDSSWAPRRPAPAQYKCSQNRRTSTPLLQYSSLRYHLSPHSCPHRRSAVVSP